MSYSCAWYGKLTRGIANLINSRLAKAGAWLMMANLLSGALGYVFQVVMGRLLAPAEYGLLSAMIALGLIFPVPMGAAMLILTRKYAEYFATGELGKVAHLSQRVQRWILIIGVIALSSYLFGSSWIAKYLGTSDQIAVMLLGVWIFVLIISGGYPALLQGGQLFTWIGVASIIFAFAKMVFSVGLVWMGYHVVGAMLGLTLASAILLGVYYWSSRKFTKEKVTPCRHTISIRESLPIAFASASFLVMTQIDVVLVKHYFPAHEAGIYAAASALGKAVLFLASAVAGVLMSMVAENEARNNRSGQLLIQAIILVGALAGGGALVFFMFPEFLISTFFGDAYVDAVDVMRYYGIAMFPLALVMVAEHFLIAKGKVVFAYIFALVAPLQVFAVHLYHESLIGVVMIMLTCSGGVMFVGYGMLLKNYVAGKA